MKGILHMLVVTIALQNIDTMLVGRWQLVASENEKGELKAEAVFNEDHTLEVMRNDRVMKGTWKVTAGKEKSLLQLTTLNGNIEFMPLQFAHDTLILIEGREEIRFIRAN